MAECDPSAAAEAWRAFAVSRSFLALGLAMWRGGKQVVAGRRDGDVAEPPRAERRYP